MQKKVRVLEVNDIDLAGKIFNGYNFIDNLDKDKFDIKQAVLFKTSSNSNVIKLLENESFNKAYYELMKLEDKYSIHNVLSITSPILNNTKEYKQADIIHLHMFHNAKLSIASLYTMAKEKKVILTLHDPWFLTGRCVHFFNCNKWKYGCKNCKHLDNLFQLKEDNCNFLWNLKKEVFKNIDIDIVVTSIWMLDLVKASPILKNQKNIHYIPLGVNTNKFKSVKNLSLKKKLNIPEENIVLFHRAQKDFKGTEYVLDALKKLKTNKSITIITCSVKGLLDEINNKYQVIDLGHIDENMIIKIMNICDIFLMPSKGESFGMMALEAMSSSKPVIIFDNSALPSVTFAPECGYLVKNCDSKDLMKAIKFLVENEDERIKRGKLGRKICLSNYSETNYYKNIENLYIEVDNRIKIKNEDNKKYHIFNNNIKKIIKNKNITLKTIIKIEKYNNNIYKKLTKQPFKYSVIKYIKKHKLIYKYLHKCLTACRLLKRFILSLVHKDRKSNYEK